MRRIAVVALRALPRAADDHDIRLAADEHVALQLYVSLARIVAQADLPFSVKGENIVDQRIAVGVMLEVPLRGTVIAKVAANGDAGRALVEENAAPAVPVCRMLHIADDVPLDNRIVLHAQQINPAQVGQHPLPDIFNQIGGNPPAIGHIERLAPHPADGHGGIVTVANGVADDFAARGVHDEHRRRVEEHAAVALDHIVAEGYIGRGIRLHIRVAAADIKRLRADLRKIAVHDARVLHALAQPHAASAHIAENAIVNRNSVAIGENERAFHIHGGLRVIVGEVVVGVIPAGLGESDPFQRQSADAFKGQQAREHACVKRRVFHRFPVARAVIQRPRRLVERPLARRHRRLPDVLQPEEVARLHGHRRRAIQRNPSRFGGIGAHGRAFVLPPVHEADAAAGRVERDALRPGIERAAARKGVGFSVFRILLERAGHPERAHLRPAGALTRAVVAVEGVDRAVRRLRGPDGLPAKLRLAPAVHAHASGHDRLLVPVGADAELRRQIPARLQRGVQLVPPAPQPDRRAGNAAAHTQKRLAERLQRFVKGARIVVVAPGRNVNFARARVIKQRLQRRFFRQRAGAQGGRQRAERANP